MVNPLREEVKIKSITKFETKDGEDNIKEFRLSVSAINAFIARQKTRRFIRQRHPSTKNILTPTVEGEKNEKQTRIRSMFPDTFHTKEFDVKVTVIT